MNEETLFHLAREKPAAERAAFLDQACEDDTALRKRVEVLLHAHETSGDFLAQPAMAGPDAAGEVSLRTQAEDGAQSQGNGDSTRDRCDPNPRLGEVLAGRYKLIEEIGQGGMGTVFMAQQTEPVKRLVAVKIIKPGMDSKEVLARFEAERQALALMDHPNIARVLDAGSIDSGRPFFVMELVKGTPITQFSDQHRLTPRERLELFLPACQAIQHAHQKGVIHRDIKPSNVLVAQYDDRHVPKVIDFGLAKATGQALTEKSLVTGFGALVGTPEYMSPEQANLNNLDIDTRCDVYSLGVLLYELLTGSTPVDRKSLANAALWEVLRIVREVEAPRPSTKLSSSGNLSSIAANRSTEPARLTRFLQGELDWVLLKALEKDRGRRYETASGLARDIQRYLRDEVVEARPPSTSYRLWKFARRHKVEMIAGGLVILGSLTGVVGTTFGLFRAQEALGRAEAGERLAGDRLVQVVEEKKRIEEEKKKVETERKKTDTARRLTQRQLALSDIDRGMDELEHGDPCQGYAFLGEAYREANDAPDLRVSVRALLGAWGLYSPRVLPNNGQVYAVAFSPDGTKIATADGDWGSSKGEARLWDTATGKPLGPPMKHEGWVKAVAFSPDGTKIVTASSGEARLWDATTRKPLGLPMKHEGQVDSVAFSPNGTKIATASRDKTARLWDTATGKPLGPPMEHENWVNAVAFSPDGTKIVTASSWEARLWDATTRKPLGLPMKHEGQVDSVAFSPDGTKIATASGDKTARLWDTATGKPLGPPIKHEDGAYAVAFSPDGTKIATWGAGDTARLWDAATGKPLGLPMKHEEGIYAATFSPDGTKIATASFDSTARLWDAATGKPLGPPMKHEDWVKAVAFSPDGTTIATACEAAARLWDLSMGKPLVLPMKHDTYVFRVAFSSDGTKIATVSSGDARLWDATTGKPLGTPIKHENWVHAVAISPDGTKIVTASSGLVTASSGDARLWDATTGKPLGVPMNHINGVEFVTFSSDGTKIVTASSAEVRLWDATTGKPLGVPMKHKYWVSAVAFSPDGTKIAAWGGDTARLWDTAATDKPLGPPMKHEDWVNAVAFSPDGTKIVTASSWEARLWDATRGKPLGVLVKHENGVNAVAFSPDGTKIAIASGGTVRLWEVATGKPLGVRMKHKYVVMAVTFSPDGKSIATASRDKTARLWDTATGKPLGPPMKHEDWVNAVAFSPDGTKIATASNDGTARLWRMPRSLLDDPTWIAAYAPVISGWKEDNERTLHPISAEAADANWTEIMKSPAWVEYSQQTLEESRRVSHESEAVHWEPEQNAFASAFHLKCLIDRNPRDNELRHRLDVVCRAMNYRLPNAKRLVPAAERWGLPPNGSEIACLVESQQRRLDLQIIDVSTGVARLLTEDAHDPAWQPGEGRWIAFERRNARAADSPEIWLVRSSGGMPKKLCDGQYPSWSADGKTVYCYSSLQKTIFAVDPATSNRKALVATEHWYPAISPDGKRIAHLKDGRLAIDDVASGKTMRTLPLTGWQGLFPGWSPDGKQVAFGSFGGTNQVGLWLLDVETGRKTLIGDGPWTMPVWSPDGSKFTFQYRGPGEKSIWMVDAKELAKLKPESDGQ
jgi:eukaryotic-like serine/threonine-protein kinase